MNQIFVWVKYQESQAVEIDATDCRNVDGLKRAVKNDLELSAPLQEITLCTTSTTEGGAVSRIELDPGLSMAELAALESFVPNSSTHPLVIQIGLFQLFSLDF